MGIAAPPIGDSSDWDSDPNAWDTDTTAWLDTVFQAIEDSVILASTEDLKLFLGNSGVDHNGATYNCTLSQYGRDLGDPGVEKMVRRAWPHINAPVDTSFTLTLFNQRSPMAALEKVYETDFLVSDEGVPITAKVRYLGYTIASSAQVDWDISGIDFEYQNRGHF
jgi:hypothetical protein